MRNPLLLILIFLALLSCTGRRTGKSEPAAIPAGSMEILASTITYDVVIKTTPEDGQWAIDCLENLDRKELVDYLFEGIYSEKLQVFDIFDGSSLSARKIKKMEENGEIDRDSIGKLQFVEKWSVDPLTSVLSKEIIAINVGVENFGSDGFLRGYNPLFRIQYK